MPAGRRAATSGQPRAGSQSGQPERAARAGSHERAATSGPVPVSGVRPGLAGG
ncbi:MAG: hypothetical protein M0005_15165 [Actinomycetota bacterium]|nr:hypothetical protein [Actinomycetota bacterium]